MPQPADVSPVKSAQRTVRILEELAASPTRLTIAELHERTNYPRSSLHALIRTLRELKWVEADESGTRFGVGPHALLSGTAYLDRDPALPHALEALEDLRAEVGYTTHYARRDDAYVLYLASRESRDSARTVSRVGRRLPAHITALGQALLAQLTPAEVDKVLPVELVRYTADTITRFRDLHTALDGVRERGWVFERGQGTESIACVAATVDYRIPATDAISCSMPVDVSDREVQRVAKAVTASRSAWRRPSG
ncbi:IclR family transcriptional regulator [Actinokineospora soli]|uniref:IclR family transcriptional regulator n=1 Tax=Actinokineospora soli TaxID=1048753 RepID=A0ABW2TLN1_9PSEU